jgi:D-xylose 1-dehydrogenase (NADP+, D-xylono-1,5-lactone-forming)
MPDERMRWGVLGVAQIASVAFAPALVQSATNSLIGVASRNNDRAKAFAAQFGVAKAYGDYETLLRDPEVDAVYIPLPNTLHCQWIIRSLEAGKHVLCEKPLVLSAAEVDQIDAMGANARLCVMEAFMYRFHPRITRLKALLKEGVIGDVRAVKAFYCYRLETATNGSAGGSAENIRFDNQLGGGALLDVGCYCLDALRFYMNDRPVSVMAWARPEGGNEVDLRAGGLIEFANGGVGEFFCAIDTFGGGHVEIWGSAGKITLPAAFRLRPTQTELPLIVETASGASTETFAYADQYLGEIEAFSRAIVAGDTSPIPLSDSRENAALLEGVRASLASGATVLLP